MRTHRTFGTGLARHSLAKLRLIVSLIGGLCLFQFTIATAVAEISPNAFDQHLHDQLAIKMKAMQVPGAVIFVQSARTGSWTTSLGVSDEKTQAPMNAGLHFRIGSVTKTFTGTVILQLVQEGKLQLDDPVATYLSGVPDGTHITLRELLDMRSGLYNYSDDQEFASTLTNDPNKVWTAQELLAIAFKHQPYFAPDSAFHYSNTNFILLGMLIEQVTGRSVEQEFQQRIFTPLGMSDTLMPALAVATLPSPYPQGYMFKSSSGMQTVTANQLLNVTSWNPSWGWTAGSAVSTLHDMEIWAQALATGQLLNPAMQKERLNWSSETAENLGYGLAVADFNGFIGHNGQIPGYQSFVGYLPAKHETIVVLTNLYAAPDGSQPADVLAKMLMQDLSA